MELSKRLQAVADLLSEGLKVADIGCDHGFLSIYLVQVGKVSGCIAMDVNRGPLQRAEENIDRQGLSTYIETRLSDGANALNIGEAEAAVLAGMGGKLMIRIIEDSLEKFLRMQEFILQPQSEIALVRQFIRQIGCRITGEDMVLEEGKFYPMMRVETGDFQNPAQSALWKKERISSQQAAGHGSDRDQQELFDAFGECLLRNRHPVLKQFLEKEKKLQEEILTALEEQSSLRSRQRRKEIEARLEKIQQGLEWFTDEV
ncbi:MAG: SAM-dependent methyltransferase [Lachnospiraceae bacterium]|nr:SAM-dependent methyltransferase [Lachnospiraceae bacterium]